MASPTRFLDRKTPPHIGTLILLAGLAALTMNIFLPSLPGMSAYFETEYRFVQLSVAAYLGVSAFLQILIGPISDRYGRRPVILWSLVLFMLATIGCLIAPNFQIFIAFRMAQAVIAAAMVLSRAAVRDIYDTQESASRIAYLTMGMAIVPMVGPAIGGLLDSAFGWQSNFWILLGAGLLCWVFAWADMGETARKSENTLFAQFAQYPDLFRSPRFWGYALSATFSSGAFFAYLGGAPFVGSEIYGLEPAVLGFYFATPALGYFFGNYISGRTATKIGLNTLVLWGTLICTAGMVASYLVLLAGKDSAFSFFAFMTAVGVGNGLTIPNATAGALSVRPHLAGAASGLAGAIMIGGGASLSAYAGTLLTPATGAFPLVVLMAASSAMGIVAILGVIWRQRALEI